MDITFVSANPNLAEFFYELRQDPINKRYNPLLPATIESLRKRLSQASSDWADFDKADSFFWFLQHESNLVGIVSLQNINRVMLTAEIGYGIATEVRGRGLATQAIYQLTRNAFAQTPLRKLAAFVHEDNLASRKVLEKIGYRNEGLLRAHFLINGEPANEIIYGILRTELSTRQQLT